MRGADHQQGNAILLRGSSYAERTNGALAEVVRDGLSDAGLPADSVVLSTGGGREQLAELATQDGVVDLLIPRGGEGLKNALKDVATVPVMYAASGNNHVYVHGSADLEMARSIAVNAKVNRPGVCNAAETLLVDHAVAAEFLPGTLAELRDHGVELSETSARSRLPVTSMSRPPPTPTGTRSSRPEDRDRRRRRPRRRHRARGPAMVAAIRRRS